MSQNPDITPDQVGEQLTNVQRSLGNTVFAKRNELDNFFVGRASDLASKTPNEARLALKIFEAPRKDASTGAALPPLKDNPLYTQQYLDAQRSSRAVFTTEFDTKMKEEATKSALDSLVKGDGRFNQMVDQSYENPHDPLNKARTLQVGAVKDAALARLETNLRQQAQQQGRDPATAAADIQETVYNSYIRSNVPNQRWKAGLEDVAKVAADPVALTDPQNMAKTMQAYKLYSDLATRAPGYTRDLVDAPTRKFFDQVEMYQKYVGLPPEAAAQRAAKILSSPPPEYSPEEKRLIRDTADSVGATWFAGLRGLDVNNRGKIREQLATLTETIARDTDIAPIKAVEVAKKYLEDRMVNINGRAMIGDGFINKKNEGLWNKRLEEVFKENEPMLKAMENDTRKWSPRASYGSAQLSLEPIGRNTGKYAVMWWDDGEGRYKPLYLPGTGSVTVDNKDIKRMEGEASEQISIASQRKTSEDVLVRGRDAKFQKDIQDKARARKERTAN